MYIKIQFIYSKASYNWIEFENDIMEIKLRIRTYIFQILNLKTVVYLYWCMNSAYNDSYLPLWVTEHTQIERRYNTKTINVFFFHQSKYSSLMGPFAMEKNTEVGIIFSWTNNLIWWPFKICTFFRPFSDIFEFCSKMPKILFLCIQYVIQKKLHKCRRPWNIHKGFILKSLTITTR